MPRIPHLAKTSMENLRQPFYLATRIRMMKTNLNKALRLPVFLFFAFYIEKVTKYNTMINDDKNTDFFSITAKSYKKLKENGSGKKVKRI